MSASQQRTLARQLASELSLEELEIIGGGSGIRSPEKTSSVTCCQSGDDDCGVD